MTRTPSPSLPRTSLPNMATQLTEETSVALAQQIQFEALDTPLRLEPITTAFAQAPGSISGSSSRSGPGSGPGSSSAKPDPILILHGFDSSLLEFRRLFPLLAEAGDGREVWLVDMLGFGFSDRPADVPLNPATIKTHLQAFVEQKIGRPVVLIGASMGGAAAIDFTLSHSRWVKRLVLLDSAGYQNGPVIGKFLFPPLDQWAVEFLRRPDVRRKISLNAYYDGDRLVTPDAELCAQLHLQMPRWDEGLKTFTKSGGYPKLRSRLPEVEIQSLLIWGRQDKILGTKDAKPFAESMADCKLVWIDEAGHVPHLEKPRAVADAIAAFL